MRRASTPASTDVGLSRRDFLIVGAAAGIGIGLTGSAPTAAAQPAPAAPPAAAAAPERPHRTLLGVL